MENILIAVVIHDRFKNLKRWIQSWKQCDQLGATLVIIHNTDVENDEWKSYCENNDVIYISRPNIGFDTGPYQDIIRGRLCQNIPWDIILWATDDTIPMRKTFLQEFIDVLNLPYVGVSCIEISDEFTTHIRTTGFCIRRSVTDNLKFYEDPITDKEGCYHFEHKGGSNTLTMQILKMGLRILPINTPENSPLWDNDQRSHHDRWEEHYKNFPINN